MKDQKISSSVKGKNYERCARAYCRTKGFKILHHNLRVKKTEIDCLAWNPKSGCYEIIEVRGRANRKYPPSKFISPRKLERLRAFALQLACYKKVAVRITLLEVLGELPKAHLQWGLDWCPEKLGLELRAYEIDAGVELS